MQRLLRVFIAFAGACPIAHAADVYRWVDENGRTHFGDSVPSKYKSTAARIAAPSPAPKVDTVEPPKPSAATPTEPDCATLHKLYRESQECFAPLMTPWGPRPEAFRHCTERRDPSPRCGPPPRWETSERHQLKPDSSARQHFDPDSPLARPVKPEPSARHQKERESSERTYVPPAQ